MIVAERTGEVNETKFSAAFGGDYLSQIFDLNNTNNDATDSATNNSSVLDLFPKELLVSP